ncbi:MAG: tetratricopeptide repeat protein [Bryobacteraceae bacterium]
METVDDARVIQFLETLPAGSRGIVTSRRTRIRTLVRPIDLAGLSADEVDVFIRSLSKENNLLYTEKLTIAERQKIGDACDRIPLAIRWTLSRSRSATEAISNADGLTGSQKRGEEMLEFSFRRVFDGMTDTEKAVLYLLALFHQPQANEAILVGTQCSQGDVEIALEALLEDALIQREFDPDRNDYVFTLIPVARSFVLSELARKSTLADQIRRRLTEWYEATDIADPDQRLTIRQLRQGVGSPEQGLIDLAMAAQRQNRIDDAASLYDQAINRSPRSWRAAYRYAEFMRHVRKDRTSALRLYERATSNAPRRGADRAVIFREYGLLLRDSGEPNSTDMAVQAFETALKESPNDPIIIYGLCSMLDRKGSFARIIELAEPLSASFSPKTRASCLPLLQKAYEKNGRLLDALRIKALNKANEGDGLV